MEERKPKVFSTIQVTEDLHKMIRDVEQRAIRVAVSDSPEDVQDAYGALSYSRKFLYEYLEDLEREAGVDSDTPYTVLRFT